MIRSNARLVFFALIAVAITAGSLLYSNHLAGELLEQEEKRMALYAKALEFTGDLEKDPDDAGVQWVYQNVVQTMEKIPTILVLNDEISGNNLELPEDLSDEERQQAMREYLHNLRVGEHREPIVIPYFGQEMRIYYDESSILKKLRFYPLLMLLVIVVFISIVFGSFFIAKNNEQNKVWVGMAKETAHQLGTPVSSLMAWVELLELRADEHPEDAELIVELKKDVDRLKIIAERFSKIGSVPELDAHDLSELLERAANYLRKRMPKRVALELVQEAPQGQAVHINPALFEWVIENLLKNALDAMKDEGQITIHSMIKGKHVVIDVSDTGKGIPKHMFKQVFKPGFTTKKRGWGLGLSLTKRVVENYHNGQISILHSELGKGTTFRILLPV